MKRCEECNQALTGLEQECGKVSGMYYCSDCFEKLICSFFQEQPPTEEDRQDEE